MMKIKRSWRWYLVFIPMLLIAISVCVLFVIRQLLELVWNCTAWIEKMIHKYLGDPLNKFSEKDQ
jgi:hypothetical protein